MAVDVDRLLAAVDIVAVIGSRIALKKKGGNYFGLCPFHNEDSESFTVSPTKGFYHCLSGDTKVITFHGSRLISELVGTTQSVLLSDGKWGPGFFSSYGKQRLMKLSLSRNGVKKTIFATDEHRWFVRDRESSVFTKDLLVSSRLQSIPVVRRDDWEMDSAGIRHGIVFGDGSKQKGTPYGVVKLYGAKATDLTHWFSEFTIAHGIAANGEAFTRPCGKFAYMKALPTLPRDDETPFCDSISDEYLLGFLAGYVATDGCVDSTGTLSLHSSRKENLEWVRDACLRLGIRTYGITSANRLGYGAEPTDIFRIHFSNDSLDEKFFLRKRARDRFCSSRKIFHRHRWCVESVEWTDRVEEVFCAEVPDGNAFALEDHILTGNCFGCGANGDAIGFLRELDGIGFLDACKLIGDTSWQPIVPVETLSREGTSPPSDWISQKPPERMNEPGSFKLHGLGDPVAKWAYRDSAGDVLMWIARYKDGNKKSIRAFSYGTDKATVGPHWACRHASKPRPLYGLDRLAKMPNKQVVVLEGEGKCDSAGRLLPQLVNMAWPGGAQAVKNVDWTPLYGASVVLIPDADEPGRQAIKWISEHLLANGSKVKIADPEKGLPDGWNLDDAERDGWTPEETLDWVKARVKGELPIPRLAKVQPAATPPANVAYINAAAEQAAKADHPEEDHEGEAPAFSEDALTASFAKHHARDLRYVARWGKWFLWNSQSWREDETLAVMNMARLTCRLATTWAAAGDLTVPVKRALTSAKTIGSVERIARSVPEIAATTDQWDANPWVLSTPDGVVDLMNGTIVPPRREDYCRKKTAVGPTNGACPIWRAHLATVTAGDAEFIHYLQVWCGYMLTGVTTEHKLAFLYGTGANGKSVFVDTILAIMGDYGTTSPMTVFVESQTERHSTEIARLDGARLVTVQEADKNKRWAEGRILEMTGGTKLTARYMHQNDFEYTPQFKLLFAGNHKPSLRSTNEAMRRRLHIIPFTVTIPEEKRDPSLKLKLKDEWGAILTWMLEGCIEWQKYGIEMPPIVRSTSANYLAQEDTLGLWIEECCLLGATRKSLAPRLYQNYSQWCDRSGEHPGSMKAFNQGMEDKGLRKYKSGGYVAFEGVELVQSSDYQPPLYGDR